MSNIIYCTFTLNSQGAVIHNCVLNAVCNLLAIQVDCNIGSFRYYNIPCDISSKLNCFACFCRFNRSFQLVKAVDFAFFRCCCATAFCAAIFTASFTTAAFACPCTTFCPCTAFCTCCVCHIICQCCHRCSCSCHAHCHENRKVFFLFHFSFNLSLFFRSFENTFFLFQTVFFLAASPPSPLRFLYSHILL